MIGCMTTLLVSHSDCLYHDTSPGHPESPDRLRAVMRALEAAEFAPLLREEAPSATDAQLLRAHPPEVLRLLAAKVDESAMEGYAQIDADTIVSPGSYMAARRAAGGVCHAVGSVALGEVGNAFCAVRPPGHHAESRRPMGFCLFNNVVVGALEARAVYGLKRIAVVDFDVHHGNGTQHMFEPDATLFYASSHQYPAYPGTGSAGERGRGNIVNVPLRPGSGSKPFRTAYSDIILPQLRAFAPDLLLISAGFDAHVRDPLCQLEVETDDFAWLSAQLCAVAEEFCAGRLVSTLEGGYDLTALADCARAHVGELLRAGLNGK